MPQNKRCIIIAEAGVNHNGNIEIAKKLVDAAANAGADYVKFQTFDADKLVATSAPMAQYQEKNLRKHGSQYEMIKKLQLSDTQHMALMAHCVKRKIKFLSTAFDLHSVAYLKSLKLGMIKIPSGEITNLPYLEACARQKLPTLLSTGMSTMSEVKTALNILLKAGVAKNKITILHCTTEYPAPMSSINLLAMQSMRKQLGTAVGYSDHSMGIEVSIAAVAMGASVIEKHLTLHREMEGPDHKASLEPAEFAAMVSAIRNIEMAMGDGKKNPAPAEIKNISIARKSIFASRQIKKGTKINMSMLQMLRPGTGISPMEVKKIIGKKSLHTIDAGVMLKWNDVI